MDSLRVILLIAGVLLIIGIYAWDRLRRSRRAQQQVREQTHGYTQTSADATAAQDHFITHDILLADTDHLDDEPFDLGLDEASGAHRERALDDSALADFAAHAVEDDDFSPVLDDELASELDVTQDNLMGDFTRELDAPDLRAAQSDEITGMDAQVVADMAADMAVEKEAEQIADKLDEGLIQILVTARKGHRFVGEELLQAAEAAGLEHGAMRIFHKKAEGGGVFSMANLVEPGWFEPAEMDSRIMTPGVCLFMPLAGGDPVKTFDAMLMAASVLAERLDADLRDETRSMLSRQTATHMREQVTQYRLRKQMEQTAASKPRHGRRR